MALPRVGFIGLGRMGYWMAYNLRKAGYPIVACDVNSTVIDKLRAQLKSEDATLASGVESASSPVDVARKGVNTLVSMVPSSKEVLELYDGPNGFLKAARPETLLIDSTTGDIEPARRICNLAAARNCIYIDAPVSGGVVASKEHRLTFMVGARRQEHYDRALPFLNAMGARNFYCGDVGLGLAAKIANNMLLAICMIGTSEAYTLGMRMGLDPKVLMSVINVSSGRNWSSDAYNPVPGLMPNIPSSNDYQGGFACALMSKDLGLASTAAQSVGVPITLGSLSQQFYKLLCAHGYGERDFGIAFKFLQDQAAAAAKK